MAVSRQREYRAIRNRARKEAGVHRVWWRGRPGVAASLAVATLVTGGAVFTGVALVGPDTTAAKVVAAPPHAEKVTPKVLADQEVPKVDVTTAVKEIREKVTEPLPDFSKMSPTQLQTWSVRLQSEFVTASMAYEQAQTQTEQTKADAAEAQTAAVAAKAKADTARAQLVEHVVATYQDGAMSHPMMQILTSDSDSPKEFLEQYSVAQEATHIETGLTQTAIEASDDASKKSSEAAALLADAKEQESQAQDLLADIQTRAEKVAQAANQAFGAGADAFASAEQEARNQAALKSWREYVNSLKANKVVVPPAKALVNPKHLPAGLSPLVDAAGRPVPGVASVTTAAGQSITVLPKETIAAVTSAFKYLGDPYVDGMAGPDGYDCSGLVSAAWKPVGAPASRAVSGKDPVDQYVASRKVLARDMQVGDLVFFTDSDAGVQNVGINLGGNLMLTSDATTMRVGVQEFPGAVFAATRATLPAKDKNQAPATDRDSYARCGGQAPGTSGTSLAYPVKGNYTLGVGFGTAGPMWSSGYHTGQDFVVPTGTPVYAAAAGTVTVEPSSWAGPNFVTIDHGNGLMTDYAHMSMALVHTGDHVSAGQQIGLSGALGNVTGPHLHFEVLVDGTKVDPMLFLNSGGSSSSGQAGWGGFSNGMIPDSALCALPGQPNHRLRCDAAAAWGAMAKAFQRDFNKPMCITDSYRSYAVQVATYQTKPSLAAVPGTSNHGWALAVDLCGGINSYSTPQYAWMVKNAPKFGWHHPDWARQGGGREEPWHWEFGNIS